MRERRRGVAGDKLHPVVCEGAPAVCGGDADILRVGELVVVNAKAPTKKMWLYVVADFQLFVGEARAESGDQVSAFCHIAVERTEKIVGCGIERRDNEKIIGGKIALAGRDHVKLDVSAVQGVGKPAHHGIVAVVTGGLKRKLAQPRQGEIVQQDGDAVFLFQIHEVCADALPLRADFAGFPVGGIFGKIVGKHAFPVAFDRIVDRVPVPVHHAVGAICKVAVRLQAQLPRIGEPRGQTLRLCL